MKNLRSLIAFCVAAVAGYGCGSDQVQSEFAAAAKRLPADHAAAKSAGIALDPTDLNRLVPLEQNAAPLYNRAAAAKQGDSASVELPFHPTEQQLATARKVVAANGKTFLELEAATKLPHLDYNRDYSAGIAVIFHEDVDLKWMAKLLVLRSRLEAIDHNYEAAAADLLRARKVAQHVAEEPILIVNLIALAIDSIAYRGMLYAVTDSHGDPRLVKPLRDSLKANGPAVSGLETILRGEAVLAVASLRFVNPSDAKSNFVQKMTSATYDEVNLVPTGVDIALIRQAYQARIIEAFLEIKSIIKSNPMSHELGVELDKIVAGFPKKDTSYNFNRVMFSAFEQPVDAIIRSKAQRLVTLAGLEVLLHPGGYPSSLTEVGILDLDPFSSEPLRYKKSTEGFRVYSVGPNGIDDGGSEVRTNSSDDVVFVYPATGPAKQGGASSSRN